MMILISTANEKIQIAKTRKKKKKKNSKQMEKKCYKEGPFLLLISAKTQLIC
jgi:hypothetical protein